MLGILVLSHGSRRKEYNELLKEFAVKLKEKHSYSLVTTAYMEFDSPTLAEGVKELIDKGAERIIVVPLFLAPGNHMVRDIPEEIEKVKKLLGKDIDIQLASYIGVDERIVEILHERIQEAI